MYLISDAIVTIFITDQHEMYVRAIQDVPLFVNMWMVLNFALQFWGSLFVLVEVILWLEYIEIWKIMDSNYVVVTCPSHKRLYMFYGMQNSESPRVH